MTLYKKLVVGMVTVFILLLASVFVIQFNTTRDSLEQQQRSEVNNTINTVGLALAPYLKDKDKVAVESVINALFDGSTYSVVRLTALDSDYQIVRTYPVKPSTVPQWFIDMNLFKAIHDKRVVTSGWMQLAEVEIISHPGAAYEQLWQGFIGLLSVFSVIFLAGLVAISYILRRSLKPLTAIVNKMHEIANNQFGEPLARPRTKDLIAVVDGINMMSAQIELSFKEQAKEAQRLRAQAYLDPISKLGNRSFYINQIDQWLAEQTQGGIALLHAEYIGDIYETKDYQRADAHVKELSQRLKNTIDVPGATIARLSSDEFGLLFPHMDESELRILSDSIVNCVNGLNTDPTGLAKPKASLGVAHSKDQKTRSEILSMVDNALSKAKAQPDKPYGFIGSDTPSSLMGKQQWKALVEEAIHSDWVKFRFQAAKNTWGKVFHNEVFSSIEKDGETYRANQYLFALEQLDATNIFDQYVIESMIKMLENGELNDPVAINIAQSSLSQPSFIRWTTSMLEKHAKVASKLHFEIPEECFIDQPHHTALLCNAILQSGAEFGVDNYGRNFQSLEYIQEFRPNYVKLDYLFTHNLHDEKQKFTLTSISRTAHNLGITTIASRIETQIQLDFLTEHFVEVFQGFIVDKE
ncbi:bifunctional diguanylate cyclase/phosphodiesterase [Vibrio alginolyticus]|uniref:bifunctional diguanylate cyclase/phosphodiesterase n=1 Tax=Vibrio alginolyticus TaxID=663 RepID=UPI001BD4FA1C|nr:LapD/MoxY N-terminal periplasmic domain-containing protein [Vibrio alginolyticus]MBS9899329.1 EAL domain-containing protein [Vibrio alginolyticus]